MLFSGEFKGIGRASARLLGGAVEIVRILPLYHIYDVGFSDSCTVCLSILPVVEATCTIMVREFQDFLYTSVS